MHLLLTKKCIILLARFIEEQYSLRYDMIHSEFNEQSFSFKSTISSKEDLINCSLKHPDEQISVPQLKYIRALCGTTLLYRDYVGTIHDSLEVFGDKYVMHI